MKKHILFAALSVIIFLELGMFVYREYSAEWKTYQATYYEMLAEKMDDPKLAASPLRVNQIWDKHLNRPDRCVTCHAGIANPAFENEPQPYTTHPSFKDEGFISKHPFEKFGCTICHEGDGQAVTVAATHGVVRHLDRQLLSGPYVQAACTKCHYELYSRDLYWPEADVLMKGKQLAYELGCGACHAIRQFGTDPTAAPDISSLGSKTELAFSLVHDFSRLESEDHITRVWEWEHFKNPRKIVPGNPDAPNPRDRTSPTIMPDWDLTDEEATALTVFVLSLRDPQVENIPRKYLPKVDSHDGFMQYRD
ncbi:MAG: c-type cytochrome [Nitrospira sp.]|nr:c-type cytochrome [Candidatus Manganitrophaceae bacterium]HIL34035.1 c-type cytochrome [Candidatus Manganitrophaceae bacterium]